MKSRTKKNNKVSVFLAFGKGIAGADAIWSAMLFLHAGFKVCPVFLDGASEWVSEKAIYELCGIKPAYSTDISDANFDNAKWLKSSKINFGFGIFVNPDRAEILDYCLPEPENKVLSFLKSRTDKTYWLFEQDFDTDGIDLSHYTLSRDILKNRDIFLKVFSQAVSNVSAKALLRHYSYYIEDNIVFKKILSESFEDLFMCSVIRPSDADFCIRALSENSFSVILKNQNEFQAEYCKNGLVVRFGEETRLMPGVIGQSCFKRFASFLVTELSRLSESA
ncbi:MAG: hypothetical protein PHF29_01715 [Candidatus Riflebacteria bacterium]|nr:hypothetical protein [Candidatus Riflebacteria bacterium]